MSIVVEVLRAASLLAFAAPILLTAPVRDREGNREAERRHGGRAPVVANFAAFGLFFALLIAFAGSTDGHAMLALSLCGCLLALAGAALVLRARAKLGAAWSFVPAGDQGTGFVTTGPYRLIRHPIYLGLLLLATGQALAFTSWPAVATVLFAIAPTFVWRAYAEERLLADMFGDRYACYRKQTKLMIPYLL